MKPLSLRGLRNSEGRHLVNQIKVAAQFTPDRTSAPLENRIALGNGEARHEVRVTILPTTKREAAHRRILSPPTEMIRPTELGLSEAALSLVRETLKRPEGLILISVPRHLLGSALRLAISQALVRRVCGECAEQRQPSDEEHELFRAEGLDVPSRVPRARGCEKCHDIGYRGRTGVFQVVAFDP